MSPFRFFILCGLLYLLYKLLRSGKGKRQEVQEDVLVEDPVCHVFLPREQAVSCRKNGEKHYFCSKECRDKFKKGKNHNNEE